MRLTRTPSTVSDAHASAEGACAHGRGGFTLVELLVIIAVIALLLAILGPSMSGIVRLTHSVTCSSNVHQLGNAAHSYATDNDAYLPRDIWPHPDADPERRGHYFFAARFLPYVSNTSLPPGKYTDSDYNAIYELLKPLAVYRCPAVDKPGYVLNYVVNGCDFAMFQKGHGYLSSPAVKVTHMQVDPPATLYLTEFNPDYPGQTPTGFGVYDVWVPGHMAFNGPAPNPTPRMIHADDDRHFGATTVAFFDGHAETRQLTPDQVPLTLMNPLDTSQEP